jgi:hypothetical protein
VQANEKKTKQTPGRRPDDQRHTSPYSSPEAWIMRPTSAGTPPPVLVLFSTSSPHIARGRNQLGCPVTLPWAATPDGNRTLICFAMLWPLFPSSCDSSLTASRTHQQTPAPALSALPRTAGTVSDWMAFIYECLLSSTSSPDPARTLVFTNGEKTLRGAKLWLFPVGNTPRQCLTHPYQPRIGTPLCGAS